jgi:hypothetical protein
VILVEFAQSLGCRKYFGSCRTEVLERFVFLVLLFRYSLVRVEVKFS